MQYCHAVYCFTLTGLFLFELLQRLKIHPVQCGLVGLALAIFYLLLMSLAEHIGFAFAYAISAFSCVGLMGIYVSFTLKTRTRAFGFSAELAVLYLLLYRLLSSEDYALLIGAILIFFVLGACMMLGRSLDWYSIEKSEPENNINL